MAGATENALQGLKTLLDQLASDQPDVVPAVLRNEDLSSRLTEFNSENLSSYGNLWDGKQIERESYLGAGLGGANGYGITHEARLELVFCGGNDGDRDLVVDAALTAINDAIVADPTLGDTVDDAEFGDLEFQGSGLVTDGIPHAKGVIVPIVLTFRSSRPF